MLSALCVLSACSLRALCEVGALEDLCRSPSRLRVGAEVAERHWDEEVSRKCLGSV